MTTDQERAASMARHPAGKGRTPAMGLTRQRVVVELTDAQLTMMEAAVYGAGWCSPGKADPEVLLWQYLRLMEAQP